MPLAAAADDWFGTDAETLVYVGVGALAMYAAVIVLARLGGLRSFAKMSAFDFAMSVGLGTIVATTALSREISVPEGVTAAALLFAAQAFVGLGRRRFGASTLVDNIPRLLMRDGSILPEQLAAAQMTERDLAARLRSHGVRNRSEVLAVVMETTGDVSVILRDERHPELEPGLLEGVDA